ncbi:binary toxin-like calcium binding domain-containing protein [Bacillus cereus group sp. BfR-BA-01347]|uniref:binary toxin-like calcium binding domain-containing protein n=1 Tax=Bacillus cereus group sp. BfR-BA-01347 TaxID=2920310 RepID=UPI0027E31DE9|nr:binary toxin-like calcium binding domain-containing protein [Bacillus cereus group sp. BfR-BA-01347]
MKKKLASVVTCTLLAPMFLNGHVNTVYADSKTNQISTTQENQQKEMDRKGLLGYYFKGKDFSNLIMFAPTRDNTLIYDQQTANTLLDKKQQEYQSIRWIGLIQSKETGDFTLNLSDDEHAIIEIDGKIISHKGKEKQVVHLEKGKLVPIKVEYQSDETLNMDSQTFKNLKLFKVDSQNQSHQVQLDELRNPAFNKKETQEFIVKASKTNLFTQKTNRDIDEVMDTDGDSIPDLWEKNGYTIQGKIAVKWDDSLANKGYIKYVSNPYESHTVGDPYTDYEKAAKDIPKANAKETFNPLVAAFPSVNVGLEKVVISKNEDLSHSVGSNSSENWSYTNTEGVDVTAGWEGLGPKFGVSVNYQHSETVAKEWGSSTDDTSHINGAQSAFLNANVRYHNVGTGAIYNVKPTTSFVLDGTTIGTIKAKENTTALSLSSKDSYPKLGQNGIAINTMDDFNSHPIPLNKEQLETYISNKKPILLETNQTEGQYAIQDVNGQTVISGEWNGVQQQIEYKTTSIIVDTGKSVSEKRVAGKDYTDPEDLTPEITLKEALKLAYPDEITEKEGLLFYNDRPLYEEVIQSFVDEYTSKQIKKQLTDTTGKFKNVKNLYDIKLEPKMNFTIKMNTIYDGAESGNLTTNEIGTWSEAKAVNNKTAANTGKFSYNTNGKAKVTLRKEAKEKLQPNTNYYLSFYARNSNTGNQEFPVTIYDINGKEIISKKIKTTNNYQKYNILISNMKKSEIGSITFDTSGKFSLNIDDVAFTAVGAEKVGIFDAEQIKQGHQFEKWNSKNDGLGYIRGIMFSKVPKVEVEYQVQRTDDSGNWVWDSIVAAPNVDGNGKRTLNFTGTHGVRVYAVDKNNDDLKVLLKEYMPFSQEHHVEKWNVVSKKVGPGANLTEKRYIDDITFKNAKNRELRYKLKVNGQFTTIKPAYKIDAQGKRKVNFLEFNKGEGYREIANSKVIDLEVYAVDEKDDNIFEKVARYDLNSALYLFEHGGAEGSYLDFAYSTNISDLRNKKFNDVISTIVLPPNSSITIYEHVNYKGLSKTIPNPDKQNYKIIEFLKQDTWWNDKISSFKFTKK